MHNYICNECKFYTNKKENYMRHCKTAKHANMKVAKLTCENEKLMQQIESLKNELNFFKLSFTNRNNELELLRAITKNKLMKNTPTSYIINNYSNAPDIEEPNLEENFERYSNLKGDIGFAELIKKLYCEDIEPENRSIWCIDPSRNKYLLRDEGIWITDLEGKLFCDKTTRKLAGQFLQHINEQLTLNANNCQDIINLNYFVIYLHETNKIPNKAKKYLLFNTDK